MFDTDFEVEVDTTGNGDYELVWVEGDLDSYKVVALYTTKTEVYDTSTEDPQVLADWVEKHTEKLDKGVRDYFIDNAVAAAEDAETRRQESGGW